MNIIYEQMKDLIPQKRIFKEREEHEFLILMSKSNSIHYLNSVAKEFYLNINGVNSIQNIFDMILNDYDVPREELENDILELIRDLQWKELITLKVK